MPKVGKKHFTYDAKGRRKAKAYAKKTGKKVTHKKKSKSKKSPKSLKLKSKKYVLSNNIDADFWLVKDAYHVDAMLKYPNEYGLKMKNFFEKYLEN